MTLSQLDDYLERMSSKHRSTFGRLVKLLGKQRSLRDNLTAALAIAELQPPNSGYRSGWMEQLCQALTLKGVSISTSLGYRLLKFANMFPGPEGTFRVQELDGKIPWDSMMRLLHVGDAELRESILETVVAEQLSTRDVRRLISVKTNYRRSRGSRRLANPETHPNRALRNLLAFTSKWPAVRGAWLDKDDRILKKAAKFKVGHLTDDYLKDLADVINDLAKMTQSTKELSAQLASHLQKLRGKQGTVKVSPTKPT